MTKKQTPKEQGKVLLQFPKAMLEQVDFVATIEHRSRSELMREAMRRYLEQFKAANPRQILPVIALAFFLCLPANAQIVMSHPVTVDLRGMLPVPSAEQVMLDDEVAEEKSTPPPPPDPSTPPEPCVMFIIHGALVEPGTARKSRAAVLKSQTAANIATAIQKLLEMVWLVNNWGQRM
jgi:hypothetical protein